MSRMHRVASDVIGVEPPPEGVRALASAAERLATVGPVFGHRRRGLRPGGSVVARKMCDAEDLRMATGHREMPVVLKLRSTGQPMPALQSAFCSRTVVCYRKSGRVFSFILFWNTPCCKHRHRIDWTAPPITSYNVVCTRIENPEAIWGTCFHCDKCRTWLGRFVHGSRD